jgi:CHAT domain
MNSDLKIGRSEALRRAMLAYMNAPSEELNAYPAFWAPFILVGEGGESEALGAEVRKQIEAERQAEVAKEEEAKLAPNCEPLKIRHYLL